MVNFLDLCALSLPNGFTASGLPTALHIVCKGYDEATALRIAWAYEQATEWHSRRPPSIDPIERYGRWQRRPGAG